VAKPGRPPLPAEDALTEVLKVRLSTRELADVREACDTLGIDLSQATRDALAEWAADFHERRLFDRRTRQEPVTVDRRRSPDRRRVHVVTLVPACPEPLST